MGKITVINTLIGSLFVYKLSVLDLLSVEQVHEIEKGIKKFLWDGKKSKIRLRILQNDKFFGGLRLKT